MKKHYSTRYFLRQAFTGLWRNGVMSVASIAVLMSCLIVLGCFAMLVVNINLNLDKIAELNEIMVYCEYDLEEDRIAEINEEINKLEDVDSCVRITKDEALEKMKEEAGDHADAYSDMEGDKNPLADSFEVIYKDGSDESAVFNLESQLRGLEGVRKINSVYQTARMVDSFKNGVMLVFIWFLVILFVVSIFVIINTIKLAVYSRRHEISVMRYVGATNRFITLPFVFEGVIIGTFASVFAYAIEAYIYNYIADKVMSDLQIIEIMGFGKLALPLAGGFLVTGIITGIIGSIFSIRKYLKS